jgi:protein O-GlcNAc transferase
VKEKREAEALTHLRAALNIQPDFADAWVELGNISHKNGALGEAEKAFRQALQYSPSLEGVYYNLGNVYQRGGRFVEAIAQYRETLCRDPTFADAYNNLGQAYEKRAGRIQLWLRIARRWISTPNKCRPV